ncbi:MAG TPA: DUF559 domain-containing protein [Sphingomicrobium sp.]|nr:DUF559 domain-containing protein [Sphingomicrobium sp.]
MKRLTLAPDAIERARRLRRRMTKAERVLWRALVEALPGGHWRKQVPLGPYYADFASHSDRDANRTRFLEGEGFRVIRFWNNDVLSNTCGVLERIAEELSIQASPHEGEGL